MSSDIELLEMAAKAAGLPWGQWVIDGNDAWNPLTDDGDALRLAVKLGFAIDMKVPGVVQFDDKDPGEFTCVIVGSRKATEGQRFHCLHEADPYAATRRAIVRAAAEIGKSMP